MKQEHDLKKHGFKSNELEKLNHYSRSAEATLDVVINDLANRFKSLIWVLSIMVTIFLATMILGSRTHVISFGVACLILSGIFMLITPIKLCYKSWKYRRYQLISEHRR